MIAAMDHRQMERVARRDVLAVMTAADGSVIWESGQSPVSALCKAWLEGRLPDQGCDSLCADQLGVALALFAKRLGVRTCHARRLSEYGLRELEGGGIEVSYEQLIPLVRSSKDESVVCPIERFLVDHPEERERWDFLKSKGAEGRACSIAPRGKSGG